MSNLLSTMMYRQTSHGTALVNLPTGEHMLYLRQGEAAPSLVDPGPSIWERFKFLVVGWWQCLKYGCLWKYGHLLRQGGVETGDYRARVFTAMRNPWGFHVGPLSGRRAGSVPGGAEEGGDLAVYTSYSAVWKDRLEWDDKKGVAPGKCGVVEYMNRVQLAGWFGKDPVTHMPIIKPWYTGSVRDVYPTNVLEAILGKGLYWSLLIGVPTVLLLLLFCFVYWSTRKGPARVRARA